MRILSDDILADWTTLAQYRQKVSAVFGLYNNYLKKYFEQPIFHFYSWKRYAGIPAVPIKLRDKGLLQLERAFLAEQRL